MSPRNIRHDIEVLADSLQVPEGPIAMADGSVVLVEIGRGTLTRVWNCKTAVRPLPER